MNKLSALFFPKEIKELLKELDLLLKNYDSQEFNSLESPSCVRILKAIIDKQIKRDLKKIKTTIQQGGKPKVIALTMIGNLAADLAESGQFHLYRGILNPLSGGEALLRVYNDVLEKLIIRNEISKDFAEKNRSQVLENIRKVG